MAEKADRLEPNRGRTMSHGPGALAQGNGHRLRDDQSVIDLVTRARSGDQQAWDGIVERYAPLIWSICRRYRLDDRDAEDVGQMVWLHLVSQLGNIRDSAALPGWLATTTRRECYRVSRVTSRQPQATQLMTYAENIADTQAVLADDELLLAERQAALREAFSELPPGYQQLMTLLSADPPWSYAEISAKLDIPVGSIGPTRNRCLARLRRHPAIAQLINADAEPNGPDGAS